MAAREPGGGSEGPGGTKAPAPLLSVFWSWGGEATDTCSVVRLQIQGEPSIHTTWVGTGWPRCLSARVSTRCARVRESIHTQCCERLDALTAHPSPLPWADSPSHQAEHRQLTDAKQMVGKCACSKGGWAARSLLTLSEGWAAGQWKDSEWHPCHPDGSAQALLCSAGKLNPQG